MGWIKLHRKLVEWEWYDDVNVMRVFTHLLLTCNHKDKRWRGIVVKAGEKVTGRKVLAEETSLTEQQVRTALKKLESTGELTIKTTSRFSIIKVNNWFDHQQDNQQITNKQPTDNQQITTNKNDKNVRKKEYNISKDILDESNETPEKTEYGNVEINAILEYLKRKVGVEEFVDSKRWTRRYAKHCLNWIKKHNKQEFEKRLDHLLEDEFTATHCNKIKYVYNNIKGYREPDDKPIIHVIS